MDKETINTKIAILEEINTQGKCLRELLAVTDAVEEIIKLESTPIDIKHALTKILDVILTQLEGLVTSNREVCKIFKEN